MERICCIWSDSSAIDRSFRIRRNHGHYIRAGSYPDEQLFLSQNLRRKLDTMLSEAHRSIICKISFAYALYFLITPEHWPQGNHSIHRIICLSVCRPANLPLSRKSPRISNLAFVARSPGKIKGHRLAAGRFFGSSEQQCSGRADLDKGGLSSAGRGRRHVSRTEPQADL